MERTDVLVIGLGPAGACAAAEAARAGCRVVAVDRRASPGLPVQCAEFVPGMIGMDVRHLASVVAQDIAAMSTFVQDDAPDIHPEFPGRMLDRAAFDAALVAQAKSAGVTCLNPCTVRRISQEGHVMLSDGRTIGAAVLVGADGPRSIAGRAIGVTNAELVETRQITVPLLRPSTSTDIFLSADIPGGYGWLFPKGGEANLGAGVATGHKARLKAIVASLHAQLVAEGRVGAAFRNLTGGLIPVGGMLRPRGLLGSTVVLLAGDAAGLANPVTGAGIAAAVHSGRLAGRAAAGLLAGEAAAADDYEDELEAVYRVALDRALRRRRELAAASRRNAGPTPAALRRAWIAYPEYWAA